MTICERFNNIKIKPELQEPELVGKNHMYSGRRSIDPIYQYIHYFFFTKGGISVWIFIKMKRYQANQEYWKLYNQCKKQQEELGE